jgi:PIN domain nuclease of toxin-antitoxin system
MAYLVDTNGWIRFLNGDPKFGKDAKSTMVESPAECFVSVASIWEAAIKEGLGKLKLPYDLKHDLPKILEENGFPLIGIDFSEAVEVRDLPRLHGDPFDRLIAAQAQRRRLEVISSDPVFERYGLRRVW